MKYVTKHIPDTVTKLEFEQVRNTFKTHKSNSVTKLKFKARIKYVKNTDQSFLGTKKRSNENKRYIKFSNLTKVTRSPKSD